MTSYFLDTSAHLKRYLREAGSEAVDRLFSEYASRYVSAIGLLEGLSCLQRLRAVSGLIDADRLRLLRAAMASDIESGRLTVVSAAPPDIEAAAKILAERYLTAVDALQIATAKNLGPEVVFVSSDEKLNRAASEEGLSVVDPARPVEK